MHVRLFIVAAVALAAAAALDAAPASSERPAPPVLVPLGPARKPGPSPAPKPAPTTQPAPQPPPAQPALRIEWRTDLAAALREAAAAGRPVLIYFHADWCQPCRLMDSATFVNRAVADYIGRNFVPVRVDDSKEASAVSKKYDIRIYPSILLLSGAGEPLHMVLFPRTAAELYPILEKMAAMPGLIEAHKNAPDDLEANFRLGEAWAGLDHFRRAEPFLARAAALDPKNEKGRLVPARLMLALVPLEDGDAAAAIGNLRRFAEDFKDSPEAPTALYAIGTILVRDNRFKEARDAFEEVRTRFPKHARAYEADKAIDSIDARLGAPGRTAADPAARK
ncbi:MAG: DUF255 domain-containing protein [Planctomycetes bacterium]|nr:DUF255 domain-containing protein [Planctomycetota bacterium]